MDGAVSVQLTVPSATPTTPLTTPASPPPISNGSPLPRTGADLIGLVLLAVALLALGALLIRTAHSRRTS